MAFLSRPVGLGDASSIKRWWEKRKRYPLGRFAENLETVGRRTHCSLVDTVNCSTRTTKNHNDNKNNNTPIQMISYSSTPRSEGQYQIDSEYPQCMAASSERRHGYSLFIFCHGDCFLVFAAFVVVGLLVLICVCVSVGPGRFRYVSTSSLCGFVEITRLTICLNRLDKNLAIIIRAETVLNGKSDR